MFRSDFAEMMMICRTETTLAAAEGGGVNEAVQVLVRRDSASCQSLLIFFRIVTVCLIRSTRSFLFVVKSIFSARGSFTVEAIERETGEILKRLQERLKWRWLLHLASEIYWRSMERKESRAIRPKSWDNLEWKFDCCS